MSRTYRTYPNHYTKAYGRLWTWEEENEFERTAGPEWSDMAHGTWYRGSDQNARPYFRLGWKRIEIIDHKNRDSKPWYKPNKAYKQMHRRQERAQVRNAMAQHRDPPRFPKQDIWDWT